MLLFIILSLVSALDYEDSLSEYINQYKDKTPYMDIRFVQDGKIQIERIRFEMDWKNTPKTALNFVMLIDGYETENGKTLKYKENIFHRLIGGFMIQGGDITKGNGTGGCSIYGEKFPDETFKGQHHKKGVLSMANSGKDTNGSQFFITFDDFPHLDGKHVVFGKVFSNDFEVLRKLEKLRTDPRNDRPLSNIMIVDCGFQENLREPL